MLAANILGSLFYHEDAGADKHNFGNLPPALKCQGLIHPPAGRHQSLEIRGSASSCSGSQPHLPTGCHQPWDSPGSTAATLGPGPIYQQTGTSSGTCWVTQPAMPDPGPTYQWAGSRHMSYSLAANWPGGQPCLPVCPQ